MTSSGRKQALDLVDPNTRLLKARRFALGLTRAGLAARAGVAPGTIYTAELGHVPTFATQVAIAAALDADVDDLWPVGNVAA